MHARFYGASQLHIKVELIILHKGFDKENTIPDVNTVVRNIFFTGICHILNIFFLIRRGYQHFVSKQSGRLCAVFLYIMVLTSLFSANV
jgi:hypothetical protein